MNDLMNKIVAFEDDNMTQDETLAFFQELVDSGLVWRLREYYSRVANKLIEDGLITG